MAQVAPRDAGAVAWSHRYYYEKASRAMAGEVPYRDFVVEYPPLTFPLFLAPRLLTADLATYRALFMGEMLLFDAWAIVLIAAHVARREGVGRSRAGSAGTRFMSPSSAPWSSAGSRWHRWLSRSRRRTGGSRAGRLGGAAAGVGALMKVFPGVVAVPALVWDGLRPSGGPARGRGAPAFFATIAIGAAAWLAQGGGRVWESIAYQTGRGIEIESLYGGALLLAGKLVGRDVPIVFSSKAYHVVVGRGSGSRPLPSPAQAWSLLLVGWRFRRSGMADGVRYSGAAVLALVVTSKVLSPQFLIWLFPFVVVLGGRAGWLARRLFLLTCLSTAMIYPGPVFEHLLLHQAGAMIVLNTRNLLLVGLTAYLVFGPHDEALGPAPVTGL